MIQYYEVLHRCFEWERRQGKKEKDRKHKNQGQIKEMGETGVEISHKYPTNLFIGETKPKREKKRTRETAQIL